MYKPEYPNTAMETPVKAYIINMNNINNTKREK